MDIITPSDFKIRITRILDNNETPYEINPYDVYLIFKIVDKGGNEYIAISDPFGNNSKNTVINSEDGKLYVVVENYRLKGELSWKIGTKVPDSDFKDGEWRWFASYQPLLDNENKPIVKKNN